MEWSLQAGIGGAWGGNGARRRRGGVGMEMGEREWEWERDALAPQPTSHLTVSSRRAGGREITRRARQQPSAADYTTQSIYSRQFACGEGSVPTCVLPSSCCAVSCLVVDPGNMWNWLEKETGHKNMPRSNTPDQQHTRRPKATHLQPKEKRGQPGGCKR